MPTRSQPPSRRARCEVVRICRVEFAVVLWYQCASMIDRARFCFWYYAFPKPLAEEG
jgi:hypothetical protein